MVRSRASKLISIILLPCIISGCSSAFKENDSDAERYIESININLKQCLEYVDAADETYGLIGLYSDDYIKKVDEIASENIDEDEKSIERNYEADKMHAKVRLQGDQAASYLVEARRICSPLLGGMKEKAQSVRHGGPYQAILESCSEMIPDIIKFDIVHYQPGDMTWPDVRPKVSTCDANYVVKYGTTTDIFLHPQGQGSNARFEAIPGANMAAQAAGSSQASTSQNESPQSISDPKTVQAQSASSNRSPVSGDEPVSALAENEAVNREINDFWRGLEPQKKAWLLRGQRQWIRDKMKQCGEVPSGARGDGQLTCDTSMTRARLNWLKSGNAD